MASFRLFDPFFVFTGPNGLPAAGGWLEFYENGTTTPKDVYADPGLTINNGATVEIGTDGRAMVDIWGEGVYRVRLYASNGTLISEADDVSDPGGAGGSIPIPNEGEFLTGDGTQFLLQTLLLLPDPTGQDGKMVVASGAGYILQSPGEPPVPPEPDIVVNDNGVEIGDGGTEKFLIQSGSVTIAATGTHRASTTLTFPVAFDTCLHVSAQIATWSTTSFNATGTTSVTSKTGTSCSINYDVNIDDNNGGWNMINAVTIDWIAFGLVS